MVVVMVVVWWGRVPTNGRQDDDQRQTDDRVGGQQLEKIPCPFNRAHTQTHTQARTIRAPLTITSEVHMNFAIQSFDAYGGNRWR